MADAADYIGPEAKARVDIDKQLAVLVRQLLRHHATQFFPATVHDCLFNASTAGCVRRAAKAPNDKPLLLVCQPASCPNSSVREVHVPFWRSNRERIDNQLAHTDISPGQRALLEGGTKSRRPRRLEFHSGGTVSVSASTDQSLRAAMQRLLEGRAQNTDGFRTIANLAREACVSRATANRATAVLEELGAACTGLDPRSPASTERGEEISATHKRTRELTAEANRLREEKEALALVSLVLFEQSQRFAEQVEGETASKVRALGRPETKHLQHHVRVER